MPIMPTKIEIVQKLFFDGFGLSQMTCPKSCQRKFQKVVKNCLSKIWSKKNNINEKFENMFLSQKWARRPKAAAPIFGWRPTAATSIRPLFGHVIWEGPNHPNTIFWPFLFFGPLGVILNIRPSHSFGVGVGVEGPLWCRKSFMAGPGQGPGPALIG